MFYHALNPIALRIGPVAIHWYGVMYAISFLIAYGYMKKSQAIKKMNLSEDAPETILLYAILGVLLGGRLGYVMLYEPAYYFAHPMEIFSIWNGGMSFHGGLVGVAFFLWWYARKQKRSFLELTDAILPIAPLGLFFGRIGNFINGELFGRITESPVCMYFQADPGNCRYPSQLFEALLEGLLLCIILFVIAKYAKKRGTVSMSFLALYGAFRFCVEFFREPDPQIGYYFNMFTQGQLLSLAMVIAAAVIFMAFRYRNR